jgi:acetate kinase
MGIRIPLAVSARHAHLSQSTLDRVFGVGCQLRPRTWLSQTGQFAAQETVALVGPAGRIQNVRVMGPPRSRDQIELSRTDELILGIEAPVRTSGDLDGTPGVVIEGPAGRVSLSSGVISARRHVHMSPQDAERLGVRDGQTVQVKVDSKDRDLVFGDVTVRIALDFRLELHLDTDEANAAGVGNGDYGELLIPHRP